MDVTLYTRIIYADNYYIHSCVDFLIVDFLIVSQNPDRFINVLTEY